MKKDINRREMLKRLGAAAGTGSLAGCSVLLGSEASEIRSQTEKVQQNLKNQLSWNEYRLNYNRDSIELDQGRLNPTGVENAYQYRVDISIELASDSNDLDGWLGTDARRSEFFSLLNNTTYDILFLTNDSLEDFYPGTQPSNQNQVTEYSLRVRAESCSYLEDDIPATRMNDILSSRSAYDDYVDNGEDYTINIESGFLGTDLFC